MYVLCLISYRTVFSHIITTNQYRCFQIIGHNDLVVTMDNLTFQQILKPATITAKILGIHSFESKNQNVYSKIRLIQFVLYLTLCILSTIFYLRGHVTGRSDMLKIVTFLVIMRSVGWIVTMLLVLALVLFQFSKFTELAANLTRVDSHLNCFGQKDRIHKLGLQHRKTLIFLLVLEQLVLNVMFELHTGWIRNHNPFIFTGAFIYARLVCTTEYTVFVFLTLIIQKRFEIVNELLEVNVARSTSFAKSPVKRLIHLHKNLCKASRDLNALFSLQLLMWFGIYFFLIIWDAHASIHVVLLEKKQWVIFIIGAKNVFRNVFDLCYVVKRCADLCHEVKEFVGCKLFTVVVLGELHQGLVVESGIK